MLVRQLCPVTAEASKRRETSVDFHGLNAAVRKTADIQHRAAA